MTDGKPDTAILLYGVPNDLLRQFALIGMMLVPTEISWRRASAIQRRGWGTVYPFHQRWQGRLDITDLGRQELQRHG